ncbi:hypothetical protein B7463_g5813, partial [Scytalidium lignicola]
MVKVTLIKKPRPDQIQQCIIDFWPDLTPWPGHNPNDDQDTVFKSAMNAPGHIIFEAQGNENEPRKGFCLVQLLNKEHVFMLYLLAKEKRKGTGRKIVNEVLEYAAEKGYKRVSVATEDIDKTAVAFYQSMISEWMELGNQADTMHGQSDVGNGPFAYSKFVFFLP